MTDFNNCKFGFIGLGLIGGSIARAIRQYWPNAQIIAYNPSSEPLKEAMDDGVVSYYNSAEDVRRINDAIGSSRPFIGNIFSDCDFVFLCAPVQRNAENLAEIAPYLKKDAVLTDIGSTKRDIHLHVRTMPSLSGHFIGGHPMTGSERTGYRNSKASLLENAYYMLTPEKDVSQDKIDRMYELVAGIKALPFVIDCDFHDQAVGAISHLPHVISAALVNLVHDSDSQDGVMKMIAAGGFKDITRISSSSPQMWEEICMTNSDHIAGLLDAYISSLLAIRKTIADRQGEEIYGFFDSARVYRDSFSEVGHGSVGRLFVTHVDIADRPAALAEVVTLLAVNSISIKNIGISHNRELQEGVLRVEFQSKADLERAEQILKERNYSIH
ncbi:MAG: prephenate dehydrogenase [Lachnospiraceae bacterium]|nr:prephenate dehydrogenase [Lachnospiraceae bacterium]